MKVLILSIIVVLIDQLSKLTIRVSLEYGKPHRIIGDWVRLTYIENPGMAFGIQIGGQIFFTVFALLATVIIFIYIIRARQEKIQLRISLALILGGAVGNLIDRFLYGKVVDFIEVGMGNARWPIFNIADSAVTIGMIILIIMVLFERSSEKTKESKESTVQ